MSEHLHSWVVVNRPESFPASPYATLSCDCGAVWTTTPKRMFIQSALAMYRNSSPESDANFRITAQLFIETDDTDLSKDGGHFSGK